MKRKRGVKQRAQPTSGGWRLPPVMVTSIFPHLGPGNTLAAYGQTPPAALCHVSGLKCLSTHSRGVYTRRTHSAPHRPKRGSNTQQAIVKMTARQTGNFSSFSLKMKALTQM